MQREDFQIGTVFWSADRPHFPFRVALVGEGAIIAVMIDKEKARLDFFNGPLEVYVLHEFIEEDFAGCTLQRVIDPAKGNWPARAHPLTEHFPGYPGEHPGPQANPVNEPTYVVVHPEIARQLAGQVCEQFDMFGPNREPLRGGA